MNNHHSLDFLHNRELNELYMSMAIRTFAISLITIFIPIYLLELGYTLTSVLLFYVMSNLTHMVFVIPSAKISSRFGFKHAIFFSMPFLIIFYMMLYSLGRYGWPLYLLAIIWGISSSLFWLGYHLDFCRASDRKHRGSQLGIARIISQAFTVLGPVLGGLILTFIGFKALFASVSLLMLSSVIPLFYSKDVHEPVDFSLKEAFQKMDMKDNLVFIGNGIEAGMGTVIWPVFIFFMILNNYSSLGLVSSLTLLFSLLFTFSVGKIADIKRKVVLRIASTFNAVIWILRMFVTTSFQVYIIDSVYGLSHSATQVPFNALTYDKASRGNILRSIIFREITIQAGKIVLFFAVIFMTDLVGSFLVGAGASLLYFIF